MRTTIKRTLMFLYCHSVLSLVTTQRIYERLRLGRH